MYLHHMLAREQVLDLGQCYWQQGDSHNHLEEPIKRHVVKYIERHGSTRRSARDSSLLFVKSLENELIELNPCQRAEYAERRRWTKTINKVIRCSNLFCASIATGIYGIVSLHRMQPIMDIHLRNEDIRSVIGP